VTFPATNLWQKLVSALTDENSARDVFDLVNGLPKLFVVEEIVTTTNAVETNMSVTIPAGAVITEVYANLDTLVAGDASGDDLGVKVGIGVTADPDKYGLTADLTKNQKVSKIAAHAVLANAEQICVKLAKTDGSAATEKFVAGAKIYVRVSYMLPSRTARSV